MAAVATALALLAGTGDTADPELTQQFVEEFTACLTDEGINVDRVDASVTEDRERQMHGWSASGESPPSAEYADVGCENALMQELQPRPFLG